MKIYHNNLTDNFIISNNQEHNNAIYKGNKNNNFNSIINSNSQKEIITDTIINEKQDNTSGSVASLKQELIKSNYQKSDLEKSKEANSYLDKFLKKFSKKLFVKTLTKIPYSVGGYLGADKTLTKALKWGSLIFELPFAYKDYKDKLKEGKTQKEALLETATSFLVGNLVALGISSAIGGPVGLTLSIVGGALAGTLTDKLTNKVLSSK